MMFKLGKHVEKILIESWSGMHREICFAASHIVGCLYDQVHSFYHATWNNLQQDHAYFPPSWRNTLAIHKSPIYSVCFPLVSIGKTNILKNAAINRPPDA